MHPIERLRYIARAGHMAPDHLVQEAAFALSDFVGDDAMLLISCKRILDRQPTSAPLVWLVAHALGAPEPGAALWQAAEQVASDRTPAAVAYALPDDATIATIGSSDWLAQVLRSRGDVAAVVVDLDGSAAYELDDHEFHERDGAPPIIVDPSGAGQALAGATHLVLGLDALSPTNALARQGALALAATSRHLRIEVWGVAATGVALGERMYGGLTRRWHEHDTAPLWERPVEELPTALLDQVVTRAGPGPVEVALRSGGCPIVPELF